MRRRWLNTAFEKYRGSHARGMGDYPTGKYSGPTPYMMTDAENQNNAVGMGADNSINDPNWMKKKLKRGIEMSKPSKPSKKINVAKSYSE